MTITNNTHDYDGKWRQQYLEIIDRVTKPDSSVTFEVCIRQITDFQCTDRSVYLRPNLIRVSTLLLKDKANNYDHVNKLSVEELLPIVWFHCRDDTDLRLLFREQYADILNGPCAQGRTTRLFQILSAISDH